LSRLIGALGVVVVLLSLLGEVGFLGTATQFLTQCGFNFSCYNQFYYVGGVPSTIYYPFVLWNALTYGILLVVGICLVALGSEGKQVPEGMNGMVKGSAEEGKKNGESS
jgi:hypothetical protein